MYQHPNDNFLLNITCANLSDRKYKNYMYLIEFRTLLLKITGILKNVTCCRG